MVEINNQRKAFLDMLAWSEGTDNGRQENQKSWLWRHCRRRVIYWLLRSPSQTCHAKPKLKSTGAGRYQFFPVGGMPTASSLAWKTSLRKVRTLWHCSRLRSVALYLWLIVVISVRQSTVAAISGLHCRALVMVSSSIRLTAWLQIQRSGRNGQRDWCMSRVTAIISALVICNHHSACQLAIITVITPLPTKPSATKMPENCAGERGNYWHADASAWCYTAAPMQNTRRS